MLAGKVWVPFSLICFRGAGNRISVAGKRVGKVLHMSVRWRTLNIQQCAFKPDRLAVSLDLSWKLFNSMLT